MGRPQLAVGQYGNISYTKTQDGKWVALARFRDDDGETRRVKAQGSSKSAAAAALKAKFDERISRMDSDIDPDSTVAELAERYYQLKLGENLAAHTLYNLRRDIDNHVVKRLGRLRVREVTTQRLQKVLTEIAVENGPSVANLVRSALSGMFATALRWGVVRSNPVAATSRAKSEKKPIRALSLEELVKMRAHAEASLIRTGRGRPRGRMFLDVIDFLLATGCRAQEAPGLAWADVHLDDPVPWVRIHQQVIRVPGYGLMLTPTKARDDRHLRLPGFAVDMLRRRLSEARGPMVFPSASGTLLGPQSFGGTWRKAFKGSEFEWVKPKTLRKTVATLVDAEHGSGLAARQLGHASDKITRAHYIAPSMVPVDVGGVLEFFEVKAVEA
jgi:integrase